MKKIMIFGSLNQSYKINREKVPSIWRRSKRWLLLVPFVLHTLATIGVIEYVLVRQFSENTERQQDRILTDVNRQVISRLSSHLDSDGAPVENRQISAPNLNNYLQQLKSDLPELDEISLVTRDGSFIASSYNLLANDATSIKLTNFITQLLEVTRDRSTEKFALTTTESQIVGQVTVLPNGEELLVVLATELPKLPSSAKRGLKIQYLSFLLYLSFSLLTTLVGLLVCLWLRNRIKNVLDPTDREENQIARTQSLETHLPARTLAIAPENANTSNYIHSSLIAAMSHELRSPLNAILGFGQIMQHSLTEQSQQENLAIINRSGDRLLSMINELVDLSKIETNRLVLEQRSFDLYFWLDGIEQSLQDRAGKQNITFSLTRGANLPQYIALDELRLRQILRNLLDYAMGCSQDSEVRLRVFATYLPSPTVPQQIDLNFEVASPDLAIASLEPADLFNPLIQVRQEWHSSQGSSLSLAIARQLARLMGGDIIVTKSETEPQAIFQLNVVAEIATDRELEIQSAPREIVGLESDQPEYRILVVDDSKMNRKIMVQLLERVGFKVREAVNGKEAVDVWLSWQPHMIWMDLKMPVMNGYEATSQIRSHSPTRSPAIVALSASTSEEERTLFWESGCDDFVGKPFAESIIFEKIAQHLGVRYVYQIPNSPAEKFRLTASSLKVMSDSWLEQVEQAAETLDDERLTELFKQIPPEHSGLNSALQQQVDDFDFDRIINLIEQR